MMYSFEHWVDDDNKILSLYFCMETTRQNVLVFCCGFILQRILLNVYIVISDLIYRSWFVLSNFKLNMY